VVAYKESDVLEKSLFLPLLPVAYQTPASSVLLPSSLQRSINAGPQNQVKKNRPPAEHVRNREVGNLLILEI